MIVLLLAMLLICVTASLVLVTVAFPYRGRTLEPAPWLGDALGEVVRKATTARR